MALTKCTECGHQLAKSAKACPGCGAAPPKRTSTVTWTVLVIIVFGVILSANTPDPPRKSKEERAVKKAETDKRVRAVTIASVGAAELKSMMRNPDRFQVNSALVINDTSAVCYEYRAENGFGGMNVERAVLTPKGNLYTSSHDTFVTAWNAQCAKKQGIELADSLIEP